MNITSRRDSSAQSGGGALPRLLAAVVAVLLLGLTVLPALAQTPGGTDGGDPPASGTEAGENQDAGGQTGETEEPESAAEGSTDGTAGGTADGTADGSSELSPGQDGVGGATPGSVFAPERRSDGPAPAESGAGIDQLLRGPDLQQGDSGTAYERYGLTGLRLVDDKDAFDFTDGTLQQIPDVVWSVATWIVGVAGSTTQWAFSYDAFDGLSPVVDSTVGRLYQGLFQPLLLPFILLTGAWAGWQLLRRSGSMALQGALWTVVILGLAFAFLARPGTVTEAANHVTIGLSQQVLGAVSHVQGGEAVMEGVVPDRATYTGPDESRALRQASDQLYRQTLVVPWMMMNFGSLEAAATERPDDPGGNPTFAAALLDYLTVEPGEDAGTQQARLDDLLEDARELPGAGPWIQGDMWSGRLAIAVIAFIGSLVLGGIVLIVSGAVLLAQLGLLLAALVAPLFLILGAWPGGHHIFRRYVGLAGGLLIRRIAYATILAVLLVGIDAIAAETSTLSYGFSVLIQALLVGAFVFFRDDLFQLFRPGSKTKDSIEARGKEATSTVRSVGQNALSWASFGAAAGAASGTAGAQEGDSGTAAPADDGADRPATTAERTAATRTVSSNGDAPPGTTPGSTDGGSAPTDDDRWVGRVFQSGRPEPTADRGRAPRDEVTTGEESGR